MFQSGLANMMTFCLLCVFSALEFLLFENIKYRGVGTGEAGEARASPDFRG